VGERGEFGPTDGLSPPRDDALAGGGHVAPGHAGGAHSRREHNAGAVAFAAQLDEGNVVAVLAVALGANKQDALNGILVPASYLLPVLVHDGLLDVEGHLFGVHILEVVLAHDNTQMLVVVIPAEREL
jgi:hypothetical protein